MNNNVLEQLTIRSNKPFVKRIRITKHLNDILLKIITKHLGRKIYIIIGDKIYLDNEINSLLNKYKDIYLVRVVNIVKTLEELRPKDVVLILFIDKKIEYDWDFIEIINNISRYNKIFLISYN